MNRFFDFINDLDFKALGEKIIMPTESTAYIMEVQRLELRIRELREENQKLIDKIEGMVNNDNQ